MIDQHEGVDEAAKRHQIEERAHPLAEAKLRPDHKLIYVGDWPDKERRTKGVRYLVTQLASIAGKAAA